MYSTVDHHLHCVDGSDITKLIISPPKHIVIMSICAQEKNNYKEWLVPQIRKVRSGAELTLKLHTETHFANLVKAN